MIKAVFFDMGGVLLPLYVERCIEAYRTRAGFKDITDFLDPYHQRGFFVDLEAGTIDRDDFVRECLRHCAPGTTEETLKECHDEFFGTPLPDTVAYVKELSQTYEVDVLSNNNEFSMELHRPNFAQVGLPLETSFTHLFLSHEMHLMKPEPEIYRRAVAEAGYKSEEILFIDDSQANVDGARACGLNAILYRIGENDLRTLVDAELARLNG